MFGICEQILIKITNIKFHGNLSSGDHAGCMWTGEERGGRT